MNEWIVQLELQGCPPFGLVFLYKTFLDIRKAWAKGSYSCVFSKQALDWFMVQRSKSKI